VSVWRTIGSNERNVAFRSRTKLRVISAVDAKYMHTRFTGCSDALNLREAMSDEVKGSGGGGSKK